MEHPGGPAQDYFEGERDEKPGGETDAPRHEAFGDGRRGRIGRRLGECGALHIAANVLAHHPQFAAPRQPWQNQQGESDGAI